MNYPKIFALSALATAYAFATDGTYTSSTNTAWSTTSGWVNGTVAGGAGSTATFDRAAFTGNRTVTQSGTVTLTLGSILFTGSNSVARSVALTGTTSTIAINNNGSTSLIDNQGWGAAQINFNLVLYNDLNLRNTPLDSSGSPISAYLGFGAAYTITANDSTLRTITILPSLVTTSTPQNFRVALSSTISGNIAIRQNSGNNLNLQESAKSYYGGLYIKSGNVNSSGLGSTALGASNNVVTFEARDNVTDAVGTLNFTGTPTYAGALVANQSMVLQTDGIVSVGLATGYSLTWAGQISGTGSFTKIGESALTLTANNTYTGDTVIGAGQLVLGISNAIHASSDLVFATVSTISGVLDANGHSNTFGTLSLQGAGVIDMGDVTGNVLTFADSSDVAWGAYTLSVIGTFEDGVSIRIGTDATGLTSDQLAKITINGAAAYLTDTGYLTTTIPEPAVAALLTGALALALAARRRRA